jgi:3-hydroxybutyryl-CoA dehydrogenase
MEPHPFDVVCVVGAGFMGSQIGLQCAAHGYSVWVIDNLDASLKGAAQRSSQALSQWLEKGLINPQQRDAILSRMRLSTDFQDGASNAGLVIESVPEHLALKRAIFAELEQVCPPSTILTTNSSSLRISAIESATRRPEKVLNLHFFPPVWQRTIVELMRGSATSDETIETALQFARSIGMTPLLVQKESTGFIFNRVWRAVKKECLHLVDEGVASFEDVDRAWMITNAQPVGPFGLIDMVGLDVARDVEMVYYQESGDESDAPPRLLLDKIEKGELGVKTGKGFYTYPNPAYQDPAWLKGER